MHVLDKDRKVQYPAKLVKRCLENDRSYVVETEGGRQIRRNRVQLREMQRGQTSPVPSIQPTVVSSDVRQVCDPGQTVTLDRNDKPPQMSSTSPVKGILKPTSANGTKTRSGRVVRQSVRFRE